MSLNWFRHSGGLKGEEQMNKQKENRPNIWAQMKGIIL